MYAKQTNTMDPRRTTCQKWKLIKPKDLVSLLADGMEKVLLIDSRSFLEYNTSRIQQSVNLCCSKLVKRRLQEDKVNIEDLLIQACHVDIEEYCDVIVYDQCTERPEFLTDDNFLSILLQKLVSSDSFNSVALLKGGYLAFNAMHPMLCENKATDNYKCTPLTSLSQPCLPVANIGPTRILPFLYLGSHSDAMSQETIQVNDISYILNVSTTCPKPPFIQEGHFYRIPVNDNYSAKLLPFFDQAFQFLDKVREANGCVMVHCLAGISRSPTLAIAYVMKHLKISSDDAYRYVKDKRPTISPNFNFLGQLLEYEKMIKQEEENLKNRRDSGSSIGSEKAIPIIMDLQNCSPSSPVAKVTKPFVFDSLWNPSPIQITSENKRDNNDNLPMLADSDSWADFSPRSNCSKRSVSSSEKNEGEKSEFKVPFALESPVKETRLQSGFPSMAMDVGATTPSGELPPFPFDAVTKSEQESKEDSHLQTDHILKRKSPSVSPKSPASRSFTLSLSPITLPVENRGQKTPSTEQIRQESSSSQERKRTLSMAMSESPMMNSPISRSSVKSIRPKALALSPVISPGNEIVEERTCEVSFTSSKLSVRGDKKSLVLPLSSPCSETKPFPEVNKPARSFTLSLSPVLSPDVSSQDSEDSGTQNFKCKEIVKETIKSFTLPLSSISQTTAASDSSSQVKFSKSPRLPVSPLVSSDSDSSTLGFISQSSSGSSSPRKSPSRSLHLPLNPVMESKHSTEKDQTPSSDGKSFSASDSEVTNNKRALTLPLSPCVSHLEDSVQSNSGTNSDLAATTEEIQTFSVTQQSLSHFEKSKPMISTTSACDTDSTSTTVISDISPRNLDKPAIPKSLSFSQSQRKQFSQTLYSPSTALAQLHFSQSVAETVSVNNQSNLTNFPSTSLDKLNFTPCRTSKVATQDVEMTSVTSPVQSIDMLEPISPTSLGSACSSTCSSAITSPSNIPAKVILRSRDNRAKKTLIRPNSIAFSKYPTFDLGSDCQESPSSGSSTSQDDASEVYMLQNGKRTKHYETGGERFRMGKYSEREVYKQISAMESAMLKSQVYEASRKARSLDDILNSETSHPSSCVTTVLQKTSRHCGLGMERFGTPALYDNFPYRCRGSSDPYQSNSSISSSGSHSSLHGSMEIIQPPF